MRRAHSIYLASVSAGLASLVTACAAGGQNLKPAKSAHAVPGLKDAAIAANHRVQVIAQTDKWPGEARITEKVEPVRVRITNNSGEPITIRYEDFRLVAADGTTYAAVPPIATAGEVPAVTPLFTYTGYALAPYYGPAYPGVLVYSGPFAYHSVYYDTYAGYWGNMQLPTPEMLAWALPEGVLKNGGYLDGYLYFQRVPDNKKNVQFEARLPGPAGEQQASTQNQTANNAAAQQSQSCPTPQTARTSPHGRPLVASVSIPFSVD